MPKLTKRVVEAVKLDPERELFIWDTELPGFGLRVYPSGRRIYIAQYRTKTGRQRRAVIGPHGPVTAESARSTVRNMLAEVHKGGDPAGEASAARTAPTMAELCDRYLDEHASQHKKESSAVEDRRLISNLLRPSLGRRKAVNLDRQDVLKLHQSLRDTPYQANRVLALLSTMMTLAERWGLRPDGSNPCRHVQKFKEHKRERFLSEEELARLAETLTEIEQAQSELPSVVPAIRLLLFTGARRSEILTLRWEHVDLDGQCLRLPDSKTGAKVIYLPPAGLEVLACLEQQEGNPYVIVGGKPGAHLVNLQKPWRRIRAKAGLDDVRIHDLRHSFASMAVAGGLSLPVIGALLGHSQPQTTARYAHLADDPLKQAVNITGGRIAAAMRHGQDGKSLVEKS
jgi:integrase